MPDYGRMDAQGTVVTIPLRIRLTAEQRIPEAGCPRAKSCPVPEKKPNTADRTHLRRECRNAGRCAGQQEALTHRAFSSSTGRVGQKLARLLNVGVLRNAAYARDREPVVLRVRLIVGCPDPGIA